jgi:repressor LexA
MPPPLHDLSTFYKTNHRLPSYREMLQLFGYKSTNAVYRLVQKLIDQDILAKDSAGKLIPGSKLSGVKLLGTVAAGWPSAAEEELVDTMTLDDFLIGNRSATYMLTVSGDSMIDAGIQPGDIVLVERGRTPKTNDIVIAEIDSGWTMKYLRKEKDKTYLEAANKKYPPFFPNEELNIAAVVTAVVRKYKR